MAKTNGMTAEQQRAAMQAANLQARNLIVNSAVKRTQQIYTTTVSTASNTVLNVAPRNVGLILGFIVNVNQTVAVAMGGSALTLTPFGAANLVQQFSFFDLNNNTRIQTPGWHINAINSVRGGIPYLAVDALSTAPSAYPVGYGSFYDSLIQGTATVAAEATGTLNMTYYVPLAYSDQDLRGAVFANVVNATMNLQIQLNQDLVAPRTLAAWANSAYCTATSGTAVSGVTENNVTVTVWQVYYDQIPMSQNGPVLPWLDLQTIYDIKQTALQGIVASQDFPVSYANYRDFLSTCVYYVNKSDVAQAFGAVTDLNYIALQSANYTEIFKVPPRIAATWARTTVGLDFPRNGFYIPTRNKPISTVQWGNINLILNAADVQTGAFILVAWEAFALTNYVGQAQSLAAN